ncbi:conserved Plasmodium protein, unknown function [Plasmodium vinckei vinckei]|uniref:Uncharacterized protein n=1 Tax=Plasmodium vinckei vinckei TaxID=54757 RepID=A0A449BSF6_PLAVN|nr:conserved Plasmodium protein, unknown function [Plasmodium vinckei vinckei]VEV56381.1 conserved Plasmodium protein, unknown function [Plasmodium vinckei vinckei]
MSSFWNFIKSKKNDDGESKPTVAHLGEENKFYYNKELKRWVVKGEEDKIEVEEKIAPPPQMSALQNASSGYRSLIQQNKTRSARTMYAEIPGLKTINKKNTIVQGGIVSPYMGSSTIDLNKNTPNDNKKELFPLTTFTPKIVLSENKESKETEVNKKDQNEKRLDEDIFNGGEFNNNMNNISDSVFRDPENTILEPNHINNEKPQSLSKDNLFNFNEINKNKSDLKNEDSNNLLFSETQTVTPPKLNEVTEMQINKMNETKTYEIDKPKKSQSNISNASKSVKPPTEININNNIKYDTIPPKKNIHVVSNPFEINSKGAMENLENKNKEIKRVSRDIPEFNNTIPNNIIPNNTIPNNTIPNNIIKRNSTNVVRPVFNPQIKPNNINNIENYEIRKYNTLDNNYMNDSREKDILNGPPKIDQKDLEKINRRNTHQLFNEPSNAFNDKVTVHKVTSPFLLNNINDDKIELNNNTNVANTNVSNKSPEKMEGFEEVTGENVKSLSMFSLDKGMSVEITPNIIAMNESPIILNDSNTINKNNNIDAESDKLVQNILDMIKIKLQDDDKNNIDTIIKNESERITSLLAEKSGSMEILHNKICKLKKKDEDTQDKNDSTSEEIQQINIDKDKENEMNNLLYIINIKNKKIKEELEAFTNSFNILKKLKMKNDEIINIYKNRESVFLTTINKLEEKRKQKYAEFKEKEKQYKELIMKKEELLKIEKINNKTNLETFKNQEQILKDEIQKIELKTKEQIKQLKENYEKEQKTNMENMEIEKESFINNNIEHQINKMREELEEKYATQIKETEMKYEDQIKEEIEKAKQNAEHNFNFKFEKYKENLEKNKNDFINNLIIEKNNEIENFKNDIEQKKCIEMEKFKEENEKLMQDNFENMKNHFIEEQNKQIENIKKEYELMKNNEIEYLKTEMKKSQTQEIENVELKLASEQNKYIDDMKKEVEHAYQTEINNLKEKINAEKTLAQETLEAQRNEYEKQLEAQRIEMENKLIEQRRESYNIGSEKENELQILTDKIEKLNMEIQMINKEKIDLEHNISILNDERENILNQNKNLEDNLKNNEDIYNKKINILNDEKMKLEKEIEHIKENDAKESDKIREQFADLLQVEIDRIKKESKEKVNTYIQQYNEISKEYEEKKKEYNDLLEKANTSNKQLTEKYEENIQKINEYEDTIKMLENQTEVLVTKKIQELNEDFLKKKETFDNEKNELLKNYEHAMIENKHIKEQLTNFANSNAKENEEKISQIRNQYETQIKEMQIRFDELLNESNETKNKNNEILENIVKEQNDREQSIQCLNSANSELLTKNEQLNLNITEIKNELSNYQEKCDKLTDENNHLKNEEHKKLLDKILNLENVNKHLMEVTEKEREINIKNVNIIKSLQNQINEQTKLYKEYTDDLKDEISKLKKQNKNSIDSNASMDINSSTNNALIEENKKLKLQNEVINTKNDTMAIVLDNLTKRLSFIESKIKEEKYGNDIIKQANDLQFQGFN